MNLLFVVSSLSKSLSFRCFQLSRALSLVVATSDPGYLFANAKKRRGVVHASITRLTNRLKDLEAEVGVDKTLELAQRMSQKLSDLDSEFRTHHHTRLTTDLSLVCSF